MVIGYCAMYRNYEGKSGSELFLLDGSPCMGRFLGCTTPGNESIKGKKATRLTYHGS